MTPGLIAIASLLAALWGGAASAQTNASARSRSSHPSAQQTDTYARSRRSHPSARRPTETIDGMLYVGLRPATHDAA